MPKSLCFLLYICFSLSAFDAMSDVGQTKALSIDIGGIGPAVDQKAYKQVRRLIGNGIASGNFDKFVIGGYGKEGGFSGCVQSGRYSDDRAFQRLHKALKAVRYNKSTTAYQVSEAENCPDTFSSFIKVSVFKSDQSLQCQENSGVALETHQLELENKGIIVSNARKQADGQPHTAVCDAATGMRNVFDVALKDIEQAIALGFSVLSE